MAALLSQIKDGLRSLCLEKELHCFLCGKKPGPICLNCEEKYFFPQAGRCFSCGKIISPETKYCCDCLANKGPQSLARVWAWGHYSGDWKQYIRDIKFKSQPRRLAEIGRPFSSWVLRNLPVVDGIIAVPMHSDRLAERGFNQAEVIASLLHWELGLPLLKGLKRQIATRPQVELNRRDRLQNLRGAFIVSDFRRLTGLSVWLVDDVITTGATLEACAQVLLESGVSMVFGLSLAAGAEKGLVPSRE
ncbi:MAG TPA: ComF family protein [Desulfitobacteriaceae bacterium]|nr:ComF family protein [Desulfitobacteriaceae bacterium]